MEDRPYQEAAHAAIRSHWLNGINRQLVSMATGTGKTVIFSQLPDRLGDLLPGKMLVLAHREELINQAIDKMRAVNPALRIDKEMADHYADERLADIVVASTATLGRSGSPRLKRFDWSRFDKFVTDEAHHSVAQSYQNIYEAAGIGDPDDKRLVLGFTATPQRGDGKALAALYEKISYVYSMRQAIEEGWLVDVKGIRVRTDTSLDAVKVTGSGADRDFAMGELSDAVNNPKRNSLIAKAWLENGHNRPTIGFTVDIQHAIDLAAVFRHYGVTAEAVWGDDPDRADKLGRHRNGDFKVLLNCGVLVEGYDDWRIGCVILARPTKSNVLYVQMVGRGTRLEDGTGNLHEYLAQYLDAQIKRDCIVLDVVDNSNRHTLITLPTLMGMSANMDLKGGSVVGAVQKLEAAQKERAAIDFSQLEDITKLASYIEHVNLFDVKFTPEVEANSELTWHVAAAGGYVLLLPNREEVRIKQNILDRYEITGIINSQRYKGERETLEEAFSAADSLIQDKAAESLKILRREEKWHSHPATPGQINLIRKFLKGRPIPADLTKGAASRLIGSFMAKK